MWEGFKYVATAVAGKVAIRKARAERRNMLRFFSNASNPSTNLGRVAMELGHRLRQLHDNDRLGPQQKRNQFAAILDTWAAAVMKEKTREASNDSSATALGAPTTASDAEAAPDVQEPAVDVSQQPESVVPGGIRSEQAGSVLELDSPISGE